MAVDLASLLAGQQMTVNAPQLSAANAPFVWGQGGRRVTPDEIARQRLIAEQQTAGDYSPVGHWTQGLGRVIDGLEGGFAKRNLRRAEEANAAESNAVLEALMSAPDQRTIISAVANQNLSPEVRKLAAGMMPQAWEPNNDFERALTESGVVRGSPDWVKANQMRAAGIADPVIFGQIAGRDFAGPRSWVVEDILGGGDPLSVGSGASPIIPGNLPTGIQNMVTNPDGSISTVKTISIGTDAGEVLIPTVINGRVVSDGDAIAHYNKTGENFGTFRTPEQATAYARSLHNDHESQLSTPSGDIGYADFTGAQRIMQDGGPQALLAAQQGGRMPVRVTSKAELDALPSGALVMGPNGEVRRKP